MTTDNGPQTSIQAPGVRRLPLALVCGMIGMAGILLWSYWPTLTGMADRWERDPVYSHGYLVPVFALLLLWHRRKMLASVSLRGLWWGGLALILVGAIVRLVGAYYYFPWLDEVSLLPCLAGLCLLLVGWEGLKWCWPAIAFLFFMLPLPYSVETALRMPLRRLATTASTYALQTLGCPAFAEGNTITLLGITDSTQKRLGVAEACSGLSMLLIFFALSTAVALVIRRPLWEKGLIVLSAVPIAIIANVGRITATGLLRQMEYGQAADMIFHNLAGWLMMPLGLGLLWLELKILGRLLVIPQRSRAIPAPLVAARSVDLPGVKKKNRRRRHRRIA